MSPPSWSSKMCHPLSYAQRPRPHSAHRLETRQVAEIAESPCRLKGREWQFWWSCVSPASWLRFKLLHPVSSLLFFAYHQSQVPRGFLCATFLFNCPTVESDMPVDYSSVPKSTTDWMSHTQSIRGVHLTARENLRRDVFPL